MSADLDELQWHLIDTGEHPAIVDEPLGPVPLSERRRPSSDDWRPPDRPRAERMRYRGTHRAEIA